MKVLVVDDDVAIREMVRQILKYEGIDVAVAPDGASAIEMGRTEKFDLIISDVVMRDVDGFEVLRMFREELQPEADVVLMTGQATLDAALSAMRAGARDYLMKPFSVQSLVDIVKASRERCQFTAQAETEPLEPFVDYADVIGQSPAMVEVFKSVGRVAPTDLPVLIVGESGTGKEVIARRIHANSARASRPFVAVNCGALTETLLESELFGHRRGSFTGATSDRPGLFEEANGGTLLLDEITETSPAFQVKLLRVLQEGEVRRVGANSNTRISVRVISASNRDPEALAAAGLFRADLLYRLNAVTILVPPLRERGGDLELMISAFLSRYALPGQTAARVSAEALAALKAYPWRGNVRELRHVIQRLALLNSGGVVQLSDLPSRLRIGLAAEVSGRLENGEVNGGVETEGFAAFEPLDRTDTPPTLAEMERRHLIRVLRFCNGNKRKASTILDVDRKTLGRMIERHGVDVTALTTVLGSVELARSAAASDDLE